MRDVQIGKRAQARASAFVHYFGAADLRLPASRRARGAGRVWLVKNCSDSTVPKTPQISKTQQVRSEQHSSDVSVKS